MRRRPRVARQLSVRRAGRPHCGRRASRQAPRRRGARAYVGAIRRGSAGITAPGSSWPQSTRSVQRKRRPTSNVDSMIVLRARRGAAGSKYVTLRGGLRRAFRSSSFGQGTVRLNSMRTNGPACLGIGSRPFQAIQSRRPRGGCAALVRAAIWNRFVAGARRSSLGKRVGFAFGSRSRGPILPCSVSPRHQRTVPGSVSTRNSLGY
jgi:hypothetical protein